MPEVRSASNFSLMSTALASRFHFPKCPNEARAKTGHDQ
jgi:hypothetical protein